MFRAMAACLPLGCRKARDGVSAMMTLPDNETAFWRRIRRQETGYVQASTSQLEDSRGMQGTQDQRASGRFVIDQGLRGSRHCPR
jgi:hypothetical protein